MIFDFEGTQTYYERHGEGGTPLVLLHGWGGSHESMAPLIRDFSPSRTVIAVDFPGHGESSEPREPWSVTEYYHMTRALLEKEGIAHADIIAHSFGGRVALMLGAYSPELVGRLLLTGCAGLPPRPDNKLTARKFVYRTLRKAADNPLTRRVCPKMVGTMREKLIQRFGSADYRALTPSMRRTFNLVIGQNLTECLDKIKAPTILAWGVNDTATPVWMGEKMEKTMADAALIRFEGAGHFAYLEDYPRFIAIAREFFK